MEVTLLGIGMGTEDSLTGEAKAALNKAQILLGAARVLRAIPQEISPPSGFLLISRRMSLPILGSIPALSGRW